MDSVVFVPPLGFREVIGQFAMISSGRLRCRSRVRPRYSGNPSAGVVAEGGSLVGRIAEMFHIERVARLRAVNRNGGNVGVQYVIDAQPRSLGAGSPEYRPPTSLVVNRSDPYA